MNLSSEKGWRNWKLDRPIIARWAKNFDTQILTFKMPLTPASSKASRHAASPAVSSVSHPPCHSRYIVQRRNLQTNITILSELRSKEKGDFLPSGRWDHIDLEKISWGLPLYQANHQIEYHLLYLACKEYICSDQNNMDKLSTDSLYTIT